MEASTLEFRSVQSSGMQEAPLYGSSFSRAWTVDIRDTSISNITLFFLSGTASVDEQGKVVGDNLEDQTERMYQNINGLFSNGGADFEHIAHSAVYTKPNLLQEAQRLLIGDSRYNQLDSRIWYPADVCRDDWLIEADALAVDGNKSSPLLIRLVELYKEYHQCAMEGSKIEQKADIIIAGDLNFLFIYDYANADGKSGDEVSSSEFQGLVRKVYDNFTTILEGNHASWQSVVNTRINMPNFLHHPPDIDDGRNYYNLFNPIRTEIFGLYGIGNTPEHPPPSSTGIGIKAYPDGSGQYAETDNRLVLSMSALAIFRD